METCFSVVSNDLIRNRITVLSPWWGNSPGEIIKDHVERNGIQIYLPVAKNLLDTLMKIERKFKIAAL